MSAIIRALRTLPVYVVTGKTKYNSFDADAAVPAQDTGTLNDSTNAGGALGVTQITDITGLVAWKDYIPVQNESGRTVPYSLDANGYFPLKKTSGAIFDSTTALLHFTGADGSTTFTDAYGNTWARPSGSATATIQSTSHTVPKTGFGTSTLRNGTVGAGNRGGIMLDNASLANFGNGDFTIEFLVYITSDYGPDNATSPWWYWQSIHPSGHATPLPAIGIQPFNFTQLSVYVSTNGTAWLTGAAVISTPTLTIQKNLWQHIALCRSGSNLRLFVDGVQKGSTYNIGTTSLFAAPGVNFGGVYDGTLGNFSYIGNGDELYIRKGVAAYTSDFTPPTGPYSP